MSNALPPQFIFLLGGLLIPFFRGWMRTAYMLFLPVLAFYNYLLLEEGTYWTTAFLGFDLIFGRVDRLSLIFLNVFIVITFIGIIYNSHVRGRMEHFSCFLYSGSALGVILAGDLITFFVFWELLTVGASFLLLVRKTAESLGAAVRYLLVHVLGGLVLLAGILLHIQQTGSTGFGQIGLGGLPSYLIFFGFGLNCAWPLLHSWLTDTYPESTAGGIVFMATFTTKTAIYALLRGFPGEPSLIWIGTAMATFPIFYAVIENDLRRVLAYSLINQVGFMVVGIGIGTGLAMNGAAAHVYSDILFKGLLFMSVGAVLYRTGKTKATELGGLFRSMPFTGVCCIIGAASISAFPLFSGFASKSIIMSAAAEGHFTVIWLLLLFASAGVFHHAGIKIPFFAFFSHDSGIRVKEAPWNMRIAMGLAALACIAIGTFPHQTIYPLLPFEAPVYEPYTFAHVMAQSLLLIFSALAFTLLLLGGIYPSEIRSVNIDSDWLYRRGGKFFYQIFDRGLNGINAVAHKTFVAGLTGALSRFATAGPARMAIFLLSSYWTLTGKNPRQRESLRTAMMIKLEKGALPVGLTTLIAVVILGALFFF